MLYYQLIYNYADQIRKLSSEDKPVSKEIILSAVSDIKSYLIEHFGKLNEYEKIKDKLWPQYMKIPGITKADKSSWGTRVLALKTYEYEKTNQQEYNELYDQNLAIIKQELINLINSDFKKAKEWIKNQVANQQQGIPVVVVKAALSTARRDKSNNIF